VSSFLARLRGQASLCQFSIACAGFQQPVSYNKVIMGHQQLQAGEGIGSTCSNTRYNLAELVKFVKAQDMRRRSHNILAGAGQGGLNRTTKYGARTMVQGRLRRMVVQLPRLVGLW
jgi:hypothetical protein